MQRSVVVTLSLVAVGLLLLAGCGGGEKLPPNFKTTAEVSYKGQPVEGAMVTLRPDGHEAPTATGITGAGGKVDLFSYKGKGSGVMPGKYLVGIEKQNVEKQPEALDTDDPNYGKPVDDAAKQTKRADLLPAKYISAATSGLTCTVTEDPSQNQFKFDLEE
ncbi:MAG: hypothetical protein GXX96_06590 [Planctomycetaceae bacterium]|mgnify:CR=1 FL=1|nr:hypothetical protein [Planctomycetaceae bacterium]